ncbi:hypothetical protein PIB30_030800 [Stylosanthes scabra]|uniref:Uncharacterized protein n=1 Tax=Stylosanthes scabra TaxID=79078 RepID=A0ABU6QB65_9FABA|nr:hypothetical protein [Stylosanthes scabra]
MGGKSPRGSDGYLTGKSPTSSPNLRPFCNHRNFSRPPLTTQNPRPNGRNRKSLRCQDPRLRLHRRFRSVVADVLEAVVVFGNRGKVGVEVKSDDVKGGFGGGDGMKSGGARTVEEDHHATQEALASEA